MLGSSSEKKIIRVCSCGKKSLAKKYVDPSVGNILIQVMEFWGKSSLWKKDVDPSQGKSVHIGNFSLPPIHIINDQHLS